VSTRKLIQEALGGVGKERKPLRTAYFEDLVDIVLNSNEPKFLLSNGDLVDERVIDDLLFIPPAKEKLGFSLPKYDEVEQSHTRHSGVTGVSGVSESAGGCLEDKNLFEKIVQFHKDSAELPDDRLYLIITAWDFHTHLIEKFEYSPIVFFAGLPEKGKSRMAKSMIAVSRRGIIKASVTDAQLIREASDHLATLFFDSTDFAKAMERSGSMDIVLSRYERGLKVGRVKFPEKGAFEDMVYYDVFGATIISSNQTIDSILGSRTITIIMRQATKKLAKRVNFKAGDHLRNELIAWRWAHFNDTFPEPERIINGRFGDIIEPLHQIILKVYPESEKDFIDIVKELEKKRYIAKGDSLEGEIIQAILGLEEARIHGILAVKSITNKINDNRSERDQLTYQRVGRKLDIMGFTKAKTGNGSSAIEWNEKLNMSLATEHNITDTPPEASETGETPVTLQNKPDLSESTPQKEELPEWQEMDPRV